MSSTGTSGAVGTGAERRRYARLPIRLDALISLQGRQATPCVVRDFCVAGIFVALGPEHLHSVTPKTPATLYFSLVVNGDQRNCQLPLTVFRVVGNGLGCGFANPDPTVVSLLQSLAKVANPHVPDTPEEFRQTQSGFSAKFAEIKEQLMGLCDEKIAAIVQEFIRIADEGLFLGARDAGNNVDESKYLDGQTEFRSRRLSLEQQIPELIRKGVQILNTPVSKQGTDDQESALPELALIDKEDFEEFLTVSQLVSELEPKFVRPLFELEQRFSFLANRRIDEHSNPLGPEVICNVFAEVLKNLECDRIAISNIYRSLRKVLESKLERFYGSVNEFLIQHDVVRVIEQRKANFKQGPRRSKPPPGESATPPAAEETPQDFSQTYGGPGPSYTPPPGGTAAAPGGGPQIAAAPLGAIPQPAVAGVGASGAYPPAPQGYAGTVAGPGGPQVAGGPVQPGVVQPGVVQPGAPQSGAGGATPATPAPGQVGIAAAQPVVAPAAPAQVGAGGGAQALDVTFGGFIGGPAVYAPPSLQQAYSTAQTQLALRRQAAPALAGEAAVDHAGPQYGTQQVVEGLTQLQRAMVGESDPGRLEVGNIKQRIIDSIKSAGGGAGHIGQAESDAIEVIANLFEALVNDAYLTQAARSNLSRLQAPVHKVALMDSEFFEATDHPVRQMLNRIALVEDGEDPESEAQNKKVRELIDHVNLQFDDDIGVFEPLIRELDVILRAQRDRYQANVENVVQASIEQQQILLQRRDKKLSDTAGATKELPPEWNRWLERVRSLSVGDRLIMNANAKNPFPVTLVWIGEDFNPYVLVDQKGHKVSTLTMQQVAMYLRRGTLKLLDPDTAGAVDRALFGMVNRMHEDVQEHATKDELTGFLNRKSFIQVIERQRPEAAKKDAGAVLAQLSVENLKETNDRHGVEAGDELMAKIAEILGDKLARKSVSFGRLSGSDLGVFWAKGGIQAAYKKLQLCFDEFDGISIERGDDRIVPRISAGLAAVDDNLTAPEELMSIVGDACNTAKSTPDKSIYVAGSENKYKEKLEQMVNYIAKALDRQRLVFLIQRVERLSEAVELPAAHVVISAEDRNGKIIPPSLFAQALDSSDRAFDVDQWGLSESLRWIGENDDVLENYAAVIIPLSAAAVKRDDLASVIISALMETSVPPGRIAFEISDRDAVANLTEISDTIRTLTEFGCRFILDEFGSGQDNYDYLKELAADFVTIQSAYIKDAKENAKDFAMAKSINELAHFMGKRTIAKRERGEDISELLKDLGVDFVFDQSKASRIESPNV